MTRSTMHNQQLFSPKNGFTLVELMMAVGIMLFALVPLMNLFGSSHKGTVMTVNLAIAKSLATYVSEFVRAAPYRIVDEAYLNEVFPTREGVPPLPPGFKRAAKVTQGRQENSFDSVDSPLTYRMVFEYKTVEITVSWKEAGEPKEFSMASIVVRK